MVLDAANDGIFGTASGMHSLSVARRDAMAICKAQSKANKCYEYAYILPRNYDANAGGTTLGQAAQEAFRGPYTKRQKKGKFGAFAINSAFSWGYSYSFENAADARKQAVASCEAGAAAAVAKATAKYSKTLNLDKTRSCKVVHTITK